MAARQRAPEKRSASNREKEWLVSLIKKYDDDGVSSLSLNITYLANCMARPFLLVERMARDVKRNPLQKTPAQIRKS